MDKRKAMIIGGAALLILLLGFLAFFILKSPGKGGGAEDPFAAKRTNIMTLAQDYLDQHEFQRALDLLDGLLIEDATDQEARDLRDRIIQAKKDYENELKQAELEQLEQQNKELRTVSINWETLFRIRTAAAADSAPICSPGSRSCSVREMKKTPVDWKNRRKPRNCSVRWSPWSSREKPLWMTVISRGP